MRSSRSDQFQYVSSEIVSRLLRSEANEIRTGSLDSASYHRSSSFLSNGIKESRRWIGSFEIKSLTHFNESVDALR